MWKLSVALSAAAVAVAIASGFWKGSILGGLVAVAAAIPAAYAAWRGTQEETQWPLARALGALGFALLVAALLFVLRVVHWVR